MRILVMSDMHGRKSNFEKAVEAQNEALDVVFLGDGASDAKELSSFFKGKKFHIVSGNCDFSSPFPATQYLNIGGIKILATHGHIYGVKHGMERLYEAAKASGVNIALYGHTHNPKIEYVDGIYFVNPGALCGIGGSPTYAAVDIVPNGIFPNIIKL